MDQKFFRLLERFSHDLAATKPPDLDTLGLAYMRLAYELGKDAGRAETRRDRTAINDQWHSDERDNGGERGPEPS